MLLKYSNEKTTNLTGTFRKEILLKYCSTILIIRATKRIFGKLGII